MTSTSPALLLWRKKWLIAATGVICAVLAALVVASGGQSYTAKTTAVLVVNPVTPGSALIDDRTTGTEALVAEGTSVRSAVADEVGSSAAESYSVSASPATNALVFQATGSSASAAGRVTSAAAEQYAANRLKSVQSRYRSIISAADSTLSDATQRARNNPSASPAAQRAETEISQALQSRNDAQQQLSGIPRVAQVTETTSALNGGTVRLAAVTALGLVLGLLVAGLLVLLAKRAFPRVDRASELTPTSGSTWTLDSSRHEESVAVLARMMRGARPRAVLLTGPVRPAVLGRVSQWLTETGTIGRVCDIDEFLELGQGRHVEEDGTLLVVSDTEQAETSVRPLLGDDTLVLHTVEQHRTSAVDAERRVEALAGTGARVDNVLVTGGRR